MSENIVLIGFMGAGKSTVGRIVAQESGRFFLDTDGLIESAQGCSVAEIFQKGGEEAFRSHERHVLQWLGDYVNNSVIATGGGVIESAIDLRHIGKVVYLKLSFETIVKRLQANERRKRPLFFDEADLYARYRYREPLYEAKAIVQVDADRSPDMVAQTILQVL